MSLPLIFEKSRVDAVALNKKESSLYVGQSKDIIDANVVGLNAPCGVCDGYSV